MGNRRFAVWLLAALVLAQSVGASVLTTLGPAHVHKASSETTGLEYFYIRRAPTGTTSSRPKHVLTTFGQFHSDGRPHRHYHRSGDDSVVLLDVGTPQQADEASDATFAAALAAIALPPSPFALFAIAARTAPAASTAWPLLTHHPEPLEKRPRAI
jgi:hypothetical protein